MTEKQILRMCRRVGIDVHASPDGEWFNLVYPADKAGYRIMSAAMDLEEIETHLRKLGVPAS